MNSCWRTDLAADVDGGDGGAVVADGAASALAVMGVGAVVVIVILAVTLAAALVQQFGNCERFEHFEFESQTYFDLT